MGDVDVKEVRNIDAVTDPVRRPGQEHRPAADREDRARGDPRQGAQPHRPDLDRLAPGRRDPQPRPVQDRALRRHAPPDGQPLARRGARARPQHPPVPAARGRPRTRTFVLPSEYHDPRAVPRASSSCALHVTGRTMLHPRDEPRREVSASHERSHREVAAVGNPAIPVDLPRGERRDGRARSPSSGAPARRAGSGLAPASCASGAAPSALSLAHRQPAAVESAVSAG